MLHNPPEFLLVEVVMVYYSTGKIGLHIKYPCILSFLSVWCLILEPALFLFTESLAAFKAKVGVVVAVGVGVEEEDPIMLGEMQRQQLEEATLSCTSRTKWFKRCSVETSTHPICVIFSMATSAIERRRPSLTFLFLCLLQMPAQLNKLLLPLLPRRLLVSSSTSPTSAIST